jgi:putative CRISPR-associated protein (TIGR02620 family)
MIDWIKKAANLPSDVQVLSHATPDAIRNRHVYGVLPLHLAKLATRMTIVEMDVPAERRGTELSQDDMNAFGARLRTFIVWEVKNE